MGGIHTGYDYGKGYKFTWPATSINPAKSRRKRPRDKPQPDPTCTYKTALVNGSNTTTTIYLSEANPYSRTTRSYVATATNKNASSNCAYTFSDYLDVHWAGDDSPELGDCCPIDAEPFVKEVTDNGEGFTYAFPADPGGWAQGAETDERCTYNVVIDDKSLLNETTYFVPPGEDSITITANYTITSKEEPDCSANLSYGLKVSRGVCRANCKDEDVEFTQEEFDAEGGAPLTPAMAIAASSLTGDEDLCTGFTPTADPNTDQYVTAPGQSKTFQITYSNGGGDNYVCNVKLTAKLKLTECCPLKVSDSLGPKVKGLLN